jgi:hypothetical protein
LGAFLVGDGRNIFGAVVRGLFDKGFAPSNCNSLDANFLSSKFKTETGSRMMHIYSLKIKFFLLPCLLLLTSHPAISQHAEASELILKDYGITNTGTYKQSVERQEKPDTHTTYSDFSIVETTTSIPIEKDIGFAIAWSVIGLDDEIDKIEVTYSIIHPELILPDGTISSGRTKTLAVDVNEGVARSLDGYVLNRNYEFIPGNWIITIEFNGQQVSKTFGLYQTSKSPRVEGNDKQSEVVNKLGQPNKEISNFNDSITDAELDEYFEFTFKYSLTRLAQFREMTIEDKGSYYAAYRKQFSNMGMKIPTLRGGSKKERNQIEELNKFNGKSMEKAYSAIEIIQTLSVEDYNEMIDVCIDLLKIHSPSDGSWDDIKIIKENFPQQLENLDLHLITLSKDSCMLMLQKGIGKGVGFSVSWHKNEWVVNKINDYKSWERPEVLRRKDELME